MQLPRPAGIPETLDLDPRKIDSIRSRVPNERASFPRLGGECLTFDDAHLRGSWRILVNFLGQPGWYDLLETGVSFYFIIQCSNIHRNNNTTLLNLSACSTFSKEQSSNMLFCPKLDNSGPFHYRSFLCTKKTWEFNYTNIKMPTYQICLLIPISKCIQVTLACYYQT